MQSELHRMPDAMCLRRQAVEHPYGTLKAGMGHAFPDPVAGIEILPRT